MSVSIGNRFLRLQFHSRYMYITKSVWRKWKLEVFLLLFVCLFAGLLSVEVQKRKFLYIIIYMLILILGAIVTTHTSCFNFMERDLSKH